MKIVYASCCPHNGVYLGDAKITVRTLSFTLLSRTGLRGLLLLMLMNGKRDPSPKFSTRNAHIVDVDVQTFSLHFGIYFLQFIHIHFYIIGARKSRSQGRSATNGVVIVVNEYDSACECTLRMNTVIYASRMPHSHLN